LTIVATTNGPHGSTTTNAASVSSATADANPSNNSATASTLIQEPTPDLSINDITLKEGNSGATTFMFTVTLSPASSQTVTVKYATANGAATAGSDYSAIAATELSFAPGESQKTISVLVNGDTIVEPDENFFVNLSDATNANIAVSQGTATIANDDGANVSISQIYAGGGNTGAPYANDFVELFNRTTATIDINSWSIQTATATGTSWTVIRLCPANQTCLIGPNKYYLIQLAGGTIGSPLPAADATGATNFATTGGKVALVASTTAISGNAAGTAPFGGTTCPVIGLASVLDFVGYGNATCFEGNAAAPAQSNTTAGFRANGGCADANANSTDFTNGPPNPRNAASASHSCP
ncbi:MAG TPA: Calx-beta domain-containing protein, partial [Pyrinomonadaceae bacterium]|nr:Calx-beta domain-containing protein [Pyrinomonadaceae bacterium]